MQDWEIRAGRRLKKAPAVWLPGLIELAPFQVYFLYRVLTWVGLLNRMRTPA